MRCCKQALADGMHPLRLAGVMKVAEGVTTLDEVLAAQQVAMEIWSAGMTCSATTEF